MGLKANPCNNKKCCVTSNIHFSLPGDVRSSVSCYITANQGVSPAANLANIADPKVILASGHGHLLSRPYMEIRQEAFNSLHQDKLIYKLPEEETEGEHR